MAPAPRPPIPYPARVALWDAALAEVRAYFRAASLREVTTAVRVAAPAIEPYIDPISSSPGYLATSPELGMKRLLCRGAGSIFQVAHVFRRAERGRMHAEEFHLAEWYRLGDDAHVVMADVECLVEVVFGAAQRVVEPGDPRGLPEPPRRWSRHGFLDLVDETTGVRLRGDEDDGALRAAVAAVSPALAATLVAPKHVDEADIDVRTLWAWTAFFTEWSDEALDPWLRDRAAEARGVHVVDFPGALAALAAPGVEGRTAHRFESHVSGLELCNGYRELLDPGVQRRRFATVDRLRGCLGQESLPMPASFLADLASPGLPACCGAALGLDRLLMVASGASSLGDVALHLGAP